MGINKLQTLLSMCPNNIDINHPDPHGCSVLFNALIRGMAVSEPSIISLLLQKNAHKKNGTILSSSNLINLIKMITQYANATIIQEVFTRYCTIFGDTFQDNLIV
jgi:hypothetical protein